MSYQRKLATSGKKPTTLQAELEQFSRFCLQKAYFESENLAESFYHFSTEVVGRKIDPDARLQFFPFITQKHRYKMLQAARGSWKSSICTADYSAWRVGKDYFENHGESSIRIGIASETLKLPKKVMGWITRIMQMPSYIYIAGDHKSTSLDQKPWGVMEVISHYRGEALLGDPTLMPMAIGVESTGFHFDLIIGDDLQAERSSSTRDQIENCVDFYRLNQSILDPKGDFHLICTRWHDEDLYAQIEKENKLVKREQDKYKILKIPACDEDMTNLRFPTILSRDDLENIKLKQSSVHFSCQYLLKPMSDEARIFRAEWLKPTKPQMFNQKRLNRYITADISFPVLPDKMFRKELKEHDFSVVMTVDIDEQWNYFIYDIFREQCSVSEAVDELYRQWMSHNAIHAILQKYDSRGLFESVQQKGYDLGKQLPIQWVAYPYRDDSLGNPIGKQARIVAMCEPRFRNGKIFLHPGMIRWFAREEYLDFPRSRAKSWDTMDALCNIIKWGKPPSRTRIKQIKSEEEREVALLMKGLDPDLVGQDPYAKYWNEI